MKKEQTNRYKDVPSTQQLSSVAVMLGEPVPPKQFKDFKRGYRGGNWRNSSYRLRSARRTGRTPLHRNPAFGFRLLLQKRKL